MKASQVSSLLLVVLLPALCLADSGSSEQKTKRQTCNQLVKEPPKASTPVAPTTVPTPPPGQCYCTPTPGQDNGGEGFHSECPLIKAFRNITFSLTIDEQVEWEAWIEECEDTILANSTLSDEDKVVAISISFKGFCKGHKSIHKKVSHMQIAGWGKFEDFLYIHISIRVEITQSVLTLDASGSCKMLEALQNVSESMSGADQTEVDILIEDIRGCLEDSKFTDKQKMAQVHLKFKSFFSKNSHLEYSIKKCHIQGYGEFDVFLSVCETFYSIVNIQLVLSGSTENDCVLIAAFHNASQDTSLSTTYRTQLQQMRDKLKASFSGTFDLSVKLKFVSSMCFNASGMMPWLVPIYEELSCGEWGDVFRMLFCSHFCSNNGPCNPNQGPGPNQGASSMAPSTPAAPSTPTALTPSSLAPASTTPKPADCTTVGSLITVDSSNKTVLTTVLTNNYNTWNSSMKLGFNSCFNNIRSAIWDDATYPSQPSKLRKCQSSLWAYNNNSASKQDVVFNIQINIWVGTIRQFVACIN